MGDSTDGLDWYLRSQARVEEMRHQKDGYTGLHAVFREIQKQLATDFKTSGLVKHAGDKGTARENHLRKRLEEDGYLPARYAIAPKESHVISSSGHMSRQADLLFYDRLDAPRLLSTGGVQYFPVECTYGLIEVKSSYGGRADILGDLDKVAAYKALRPRRNGALVDSPSFGVLLAYTSSLQWETIVGTVRDWEAKHPKQQWPNLVAVLDHGILGHSGANGRAVLHTKELRQSDNASPLFFRGDGHALLQLYLLLMDLLGAIELPPAPLRAYAELPIVEGPHSYAFTYGPISAEGDCPKHGSYLRMMSRDAIERVLKVCPPGSETDGLAPGHQVLIYNPDRLPREKILYRPAYLYQDGVPFETLSLSYHSVRLNEREYWLPDFYTLRDVLLSRCPSCPLEDLSTMSIDDWWAAVEAQVRRVIEGAPESGV
jgi:hypothetical protein